MRPAPQGLISSILCEKALAGNTMEPWPETCTMETIRAQVQSRPLEKSGMLTARIATIWVIGMGMLGRAYGQSIEVTPLVGAHAGGAFELQEEAGPAQGEADLSNGVSYGVAGGVRFDTYECDDCAVIGFRWMRQETNLRVKRADPIPTPLTMAIERSQVHVDHFLADFVREWTLADAKPVRPFLGASLGIARLSAPASSNVRFAFGIGGGVKIFPKDWWGVRFHVEYLPTVLHAEVQRIVCAGGCIVALSGGLMNQFVVNVGPVFRF
jgi:hypothetical protein